jgi:DNA-binding response OmpR family regulator
MAYVLVIDDNLLMRKMLRALLEEEGHEVVEAAAGQAKSELFGEQLPDVVITDLVIPPREGLETIRELRRKDPQVKILAMAAKDRSLTPEDIVRATGDYGARWTLPKPFSRADLLGAVDAVLVPRG